MNFSLIQLAKLCENVQLKFAYFMMTLGIRQDTQRNVSFLHRSIVIGNLQLSSQRISS